MVSYKLSQIYKQHPCSIILQFVFFIIIMIPDTKQRIFLLLYTHIGTNIGPNVLVTVPGFNHQFDRTLIKTY